MYDVWVNIYMRQPFIHIKVALCISCEGLFSLYFLFLKTMDFIKNRKRDPQREDHK